MERDLKARSMARGMIALVGSRAEQRTLEFRDDALIRGDHERASMWQRVLEYIAVLKAGGTR